MNRLVYGVGLVAGHWERPLPTGPMGCATSVLCEGELAAAYSAFADPGPSPSAPYLIAYARVIEQLHRRGPFLPMRFACLLAGEAAIRELLRNRCSDFLAMLEEVTACDEFGLRILIDAAAPQAEELSLRATCVSAPGDSAGAGARYLADRHKGYAQRDARRRLAAATVERYRTAFEGLYVRCESDSAAEGASIASLSFLVRRKDQNRFRRMFRELQQHSGDKLLLTGPWPPYHFVALSRAETIV